MRKITLSVALAVGLVGGNAVADHGQVTGAALKNMLSGATAYGATVYNDYIVKFIPDGSAKFVSDSGLKDNGNWRTDGKVYCSTWKKNRRGKEACIEVFHKAGDRYHFKNIDGNDDSQDVNILK